MPAVSVKGLALTTEIDAVSDAVENAVELLVSAVAPWDPADSSQATNVSAIVSVPAKPALGLK